MTETDISRIDRPCPNCGVTLNGWSGLRHCGHYTTHAHADCINNLRHRAELAERQRDYNSEVIEQRNVMLTRAEAERDTAWNDAIEAAATEVDAAAHVTSHYGSSTELRCYRTAAKAVRALKKGDTP